MIILLIFSEIPRLESSGLLIATSLVPSIRKRSEILGKSSYPYIKYSYWELLLELVESVTRSSSPSSLTDITGLSLKGKSLRVIAPLDLFNSLLPFSSAGTVEMSELNKLSLLGFPVGIIEIHVWRGQKVYSLLMNSWLSTRKSASSKKMHRHLNAVNIYFE